MSRNDEKVVYSNSDYPHKLQNLIFLRLVVAFFLLVTAWFWNSGKVELSLDSIPRGLLIFFLTSAGLTILYFFLLKISRNFKLQVQTQFFIDALLITWLMWRTGDSSSPYVTLYIVLVSASGFFLGGFSTRLMSIFSVALYCGLVFAASNDLVANSGQFQSTSRVVQVVALNSVAILIVGLLAGRLADRYEWGQKLLETEKSLLDLRVLHERIVESIRSGLVTTDLEGNIYTFNAMAEEITGMKARDVRGKKLFDLIGKIEQPIAASLDAMEKHEQSPRFETSLTTPDGFAVQVGYSVSPLVNESGEITGLIVTFQDLTEIRSMEESIRRKDRLAAVGRVAAGLAHEIRNPLGAMRGAIQVLESQTPPGSAQSSMMEIILRESDRLNKIITNFLTYARPRVNNFSEVDLREAISDAFTLLKHSPDVRDHHQLTCDVPDSEVTISADPAQLKQIFWNLSRNAIQAMPNGGNLSIRLRRVPDHRVQIIFEDTGCGMSQAQVEQLFEPFSNSTTGGTGLGLSIVYQIVRDHSGTINVRSLENRGTTITVELPGERRNLDSNPIASAKDQPTPIESILANQIRNNN